MFFLIHRCYHCLTFFLFFSFLLHHLFSPPTALFINVSIFFYFYFLAVALFLFSNLFMFCFCFFHRDVGLDGVGVGVLGGGGGMSGGGLGGVCGVARHTLYVWRFFYSTFLQCTSADQSINGAARVCVRACACVRSRLCACVSACVIFTENLPSLSALSALQSWGGRQKQTWW